MSPVPVAFYENRLLEQIVDDLQALFGAITLPGEDAVDSDVALPGDLWDPAGAVDGGRAH